VCWTAQRMCLPQFLPNSANRRKGDWVNPPMLIQHLLSFGAFAVTSYVLWWVFFWLGLTARPDIPPQWWLLICMAAATVSYVVARLGAAVQAWWARR
jgi:hypothetical protein